MSLPLYYYVLGTPLGLLGLVRWACWLVRRIPAVLYRPIVGELRVPMTVVVPVYQEDPRMFAMAIESWLLNGVDEVICVIDASDAACQEVAARYPVQVLITDVPGKRDALRRGWNAASTELVALVDSDTVWAPDVAAEVCKPFADPRIGGVGTRQNVYGGRGFLSRITDMFLDHRYFDENASQSLLGRAVSCLSGRTAIYRRELLLEVEHDFMNETFLGVQCLSGDDKRLTTLILERGHLTYMQRTAQVWSTFPTTWRVFFRQRLRWARNTWRSDLRALSRRWVWHKPFLAYSMMDKGVSSFTLLVGPAFMIYSLIVQNWVFCAVLAAWWQISRSAKLLPHLRRRPSSFFFVPGYVMVSWVMAAIKLHALLTLRKQRWLTRQVEVQDGEVVRTGPPNEQSTPVPATGSAPADLVRVGAVTRDAGHEGARPTEPGEPTRTGSSGRTPLALLLVVALVAAVALLLVPSRTDTAAPMLVAAQRQLSPQLAQGDRDRDDDGSDSDGSGRGNDGRGDDGGGSGRGDPGDDGSDSGSGRDDSSGDGPGRGGSGSSSDNKPDPTTSKPKPKPTDPSSRPPSTTPTTDKAAQAARRAAEEAARERAAAQAEAAREARQEAAEAAADRARAQARTAETWVSRGRPGRMVVVRGYAVEVADRGRLVSQAARPAGPMTLAALDRAVPDDWVTINGDEARLATLISLTPGTALDLGGVRTVRLAGGPTPADAASIYTGSGRLTAHGVNVTSVDPVTNKPMPPAPGRPFIVVARNGRLDATDATFSDLGTPVTDPERRWGVQLNQGSSGSLERTTFLRNTVGLRLAGTQGVRLADVKVGESAADGLMLEGDRATTLAGIVAERNGGNGVLVKGETSDRPLSGITTTGNGDYGLSVVGQLAPRITGVSTNADKKGGLRLNRSSNAYVADFTAKDQPIGVFTHVGSTGLVFERVNVTGGRRGLVFEKSTTGVQLKQSSIDGARSIGVAIGGKDVALDRIVVAGARTGVRVERGAEGITGTGLRLSGGEDGFVANPGSKRVVLRDFVAEGIGNDAVRTSSPNTVIAQGQIIGADTGVVTGAATTISDTTITEAEVGIRSRGGAYTTADRVAIAALSVGVDAVRGGVVQLQRSRSHALQALSGDVRLIGFNDLSLPPLNILGAIGMPLVLVALTLELVHSVRQRRFGHPGRRTPPLLPAGA